MSWISSGKRFFLLVQLVVSLSLKMKKIALNLSSLQFCAGALHFLMILDLLQLVLLLLCIYQNINKPSALLHIWNVHRTFLKIVTLYANLDSVAESYGSGEKLFKLHIGTFLHDAINLT